MELFGVLLAFAGLWALPYIIAAFKAEKVKEEKKKKLLRAMDLDKKSKSGQKMTTDETVELVFSKIDILDEFEKTSRVYDDLERR